MAATNPVDTGLDHPTVVPANYTPETTVETPSKETIHESASEDTPRCPACGRPLSNH